MMSSELGFKPLRALDPPKNKEVSDPPPKKKRVVKLQHVLETSSLIRFLISLMSTLTLK